MNDLTVGKMLAIWLGVSLTILTGIAAVMLAVAVAWTVLDLLV
jgi:hypothetical protein